MIESNSPERLDLNWSEWKPLDSDSFSEIPKEPGLYQIRHRDQSRDYLEYIGESGDTRRRIQSLSRGTYADEMPYRDPHTAAPCLWAVRDKFGPALEVSYTTPEMARNEQERKGMEAALLAVHRRERGRSPTANFGRIIDGYEQSSYSGDEPAYRGGRMLSEEGHPEVSESIGPLTWQSWENPVAVDWMGLNWSEPYPLAERLNANPPKTGVYRIRHPHHDAPLAYIGQSRDIPSRLYSHERALGENLLVEFAEVSNLGDSEQLREIETDLLGAYYLGTKQAPEAQFGYSESLND